MAGFTVDPDALTTFAQGCDDLGDSVGTLLKQLAAARVGRDSFGHIPSVGSRIYTAYDSHVEHCTDGLTEAEDALHSTAAKAALTALQYVHADTH